MSEIFEKFEEVKLKDKGFVKKFYTEWQYQLVNRKRKLQLPKDSVGDYLTYNGPEDLINWMAWISKPFPNVFGFDFIKEYSETALERDKKVMEKLGLSHDFKNYHESIGVFNAYDILFTQCYPVPDARKIKKVLDFGPGYGRQSNLWTLDKDIVYVGMEGIAKSYTLQNMYYHAISDIVCDYVENPEKFDIKDNQSQIYHLPTWRHDLLPENYFDLVMCVQVLPELESKLVKKMVGEFHKCLKIGGMLYIFDHGKKWKPGGFIDIDRYISNHGFTLEFKPHLADSRDIHGEIRIYRKTDSEVIRLNSPTMMSRYKQFYAWLDASTGGFVNKMATIKKKYLGN